MAYQLRKRAKRKDGTGQQSVTRVAEEKTLRVWMSVSTKGKAGKFPNVNVLSLLCLERKQFNVNSERYYILDG